MNEFEKQNEISELLIQLAESLDLPPSMRQNIEEKYAAVSSWLGADDGSLADYDPEIYPHGSFRLGTVVPPMGQDEFDLDFVCEMQADRTIGQRGLKLLVGRRLRENGRYEDKIVEKNRCWRLNYVGAFHMDIMPGIPAPSHNRGNILVSDRDLAAWKESNPSGFAKWFDTIMQPVRGLLRKEAKASVEELPDEKIKTPLQRAIQILKRHRDIRFQDDAKGRPSSIILTTLAAKAYSQEENLYGALHAIATGMEEQIQYDSQGRPLVLNPVNPNENLAEKWQEHPERFAKFIEWLQAVQTDLEELLQCRGLPAIAKFLEPRFGETVVKSAVTRHGQVLKELKDKEKLGFGPGGIAIIGDRCKTPVRPNTFYGRLISK